jgi:2-methylcitrate dehydratase PrpD
MTVPGGATERLAEYIEAAAPGRIPPPVCARAKEVLYDGLGALVAATSPRYDIGPILARYVVETGGVPEAQVFGTGLRTGCAPAALVNGTLGYYCDIEPHHAGAIMHPVAIVAPAALAVGERMRTSGREVLAAFVLGIDVACRVSNALGPAALYARGFHPSCVAGTFGAAAAAARVLGLRGPALRHALGLAGTEASGLLAWVSDPTEHSRPFNMGLAARHGVSAAHLASCGFGGPPAVFEGKYPLGATFTGCWDEAALLDGLGERFAVMDLYLKQYACCAFIHPGLDGLLGILEAERLHPDQIRGITLRFPASGYRIIDGNPLRSHCAQYVLALAAHARAVDFHDILHDRREDHAGIRSLAGRIRVVGDVELDRTYPALYRSVVEVETADGARHVRDVAHPKGAPAAPLSRAELEAKFARLTADVLSPPRRDAIARTVAALEDLADIGALSRLLGRPAGGGGAPDA